MHRHASCCRPVTARKRCVPRIQRTSAARGCRRRACRWHSPGRRAEECPPPASSGGAGRALSSISMRDAAAGAACRRPGAAPARVSRPQRPELALRGGFRRALHLAISRDQFLPNAVTCAPPPYCTRVAVSPPRVRRTRGSVVEQVPGATVAQSEVPRGLRQRAGRHDPLEQHDVAQPANRKSESITTRVWALLEARRRRRSAAAGQQAAVAMPAARPPVYAISQLAADESPAKCRRCRSGRRCDGLPY